MRNNNKKKRGKGKKNQQASTPMSAATAAATATVTAVTAVTAVTTFKEPEGYPVSDFFINARNLEDQGRLDEAKVEMKKGAAENGCVPCMIYYAMYFLSDTTCIHLKIPWLLEGAIRGHTQCMNVLVRSCYRKVRPRGPISLNCYWMKFSKRWENHAGRSQYLKEGRDIMKNEFLLKMCINCLKEDSEFVTLQRCDACQQYYYCGSECQQVHWGSNHRAECKQYNILMEYHKPYAKEIRESIKRGDDPKTITHLQTLRDKLGLSRPQEEYEEYLDLDDFKTNPYNLLVARKDGTVHVGSTMETI
jgi:hypothetical protein